MFASPLVQATRRGWRSSKSGRRLTKLVVAAALVALGVGATVVLPSLNSATAEASSADQRRNDITQAYHEILGRTPDIGGLNSYLSSKLTIAQIRDSMANSAECHQQRSPFCRQRWGRPSTPNWTVSLSASSTSPQANQAVTLTARANADVGPTPWGLQIVDTTNGQKHNCQSGSSCAWSVQYSGGEHRYSARVGMFDGRDTRATSNAVTVTWRNAPVVIIPTPGAPIIRALGCTVSVSSTKDGFTVTCSPSVSGNVTAETWNATNGRTGTGGRFTTTYSESVGFDKAHPKTVTLTASNGAARSSLSQNITLCQCVDYVQAKALGGANLGANAKDMGSHLPAGWTKTTVPRAGAIVVYQPNANGADRTFGHVGIVSGTPTLGADHKTYTYVLESANWFDGSQSKDSGCDNVAFSRPLTYNPAVNTGVAFYVKS